MTNERILADAMILDHRWADAARDVVVWGWDIDDQAQHHSWQLRREVTREELRGGVVWANALDREAFERSGGDLATLGSEDHLEAIARRIAHHAGRFALK